MTEMFQTIAAFMWMALSVVVFIGIRKWNNKFSELYERIEREFDERDGSE